MRIWKNVSSDMLRMRRSPAKKAKKDGANGSVALLKKSTQLGCVCKIPIRECLFYAKEESWDQNAPSNSPRVPGTKSKFGTERVHREESSQSVNLMNVVLARQNSRKDHMRRLCLQEVQLKSRVTN